VVFLAFGTPLYPALTHDPTFVAAKMASPTLLSLGPSGAAAVDDGPAPSDTASRLPPVQLPVASSTPSTDRDPEASWSEADLAEILAAVALGHSLRCSASPFA